jgi:DNA-binding GntR family transcriptional regulator
MNGRATGQAPLHSMDPDVRDMPLSKAGRVHLAVKRAILRGDLPPGAVIDKGALCQRFGVSRLPVTTAINRLAYEGLVLIEPQRGSYVSRISFDDVQQWMMVRRAIEAEVAGEAARRLGADAQEALRRNLRYQEAAIASEDYDGFLELDVAFHHLLTAGLGLPRVADMLGVLGVHLDRVRRLLLPEPGRMAATLAEHRAIQLAIERRKARTARQAMQQHLDTVMARLADFERDHPEFFGA